MRYSLHLVALAVVFTAGCASAKTTVLAPPQVLHARAPAPHYQIVEFNVPTPGAGPESIVSGPDGALWFTEAFAGNIGRIDVGGNITEFPVGGHGQNFMAVGSDQNLWFTESAPSAIGRLTTGGGLTVFPISAPSFALEYIAPGPDSRIWFENIAADNGSEYIDAITTDGQISQYGPVIRHCRYAFGITTGSDANLYAVGRHCLSTISTSGQIASTYLGSGFNLGFVTNAVDGNLWASDPSYQAAIDQITYAGVVSHHYIPRAMHSLWGVTEVGTKIFFADQAANMIGSVDENTFAVKEYVVPSPSGRPTTLAKGPDGNVWFTEFGSDKIGVLISQ